MKSKNDESNTDVEQIFHAIARRDPSKRQIKPVASPQFALFDELDDDSDSEFVCDEKEVEDDSEVEESDEEALSESESDSSSSSGSFNETKNSSAESLSSSAPVDKELSTNLKAEHVAVEPSTVVNSTTETSDRFDFQLRDRGIEVATAKAKGHSELTHKNDFLVCMVCLGDSDDPNDELIECDGCGVVVHEDCYKVVDSIFMSSGASSSSTDAWFCEACLAGVSSPCCELCPNIDGAFKRTDNNRWVHLICALYTPGVAFNDPESLMDVTLTELPLKSWSAHECSLCEERFFAWTGVCISCDAGLCRTFFHVTCAQKHGLLSEPAVDENTVDPFFAQCRQHTDKTVARHRRRNYLTAMSRLRKRNQTKNEVRAGANFGSPIPSAPDVKNQSVLEPRIERKLDHFRNLYEELLRIREKPYVPTSKTPLFLENSPVAMRMFVTKTKALQLPLELTGHSAANDPVKTTPSGYPVFSPDFVSYFFEREKRIAEVSKRISTLQNTQRELQVADASASHSYNSLAAQLEEINTRKAAVHAEVRQLIIYLQTLFPALKPTTALEPLLAEPQQIPEVKTETKPKCNRITDAARKSRFGRLTGQRRSTACSSAARASLQRATQRKTVSSSPRSTTNWSPHTRVDEERINPNFGQSANETGTVILECVVCHGLQEQHLITKCDTCGKGFHLACLDPPLLRMPKRSKLYGWQCSHCTKAVASNTEVVLVDINAPRQLRRSIGRSIDTNTPKTTHNTSKNSPDTSRRSRESSEPTTDNLPPKPEPSPSPITEPPVSTSPISTKLSTRSRPIFSTTRTKRSTSTSMGSRTLTSCRSRLKKAAPLRRSALGAAKRARTETPQDPQPPEPCALSGEPTIVVSETDMSAANKISKDPVPESKKMDAYDYDAEPNSDEEIARLRTSKVIKFVQIRDHCTNGDSETVEQIAPLHMRYMICPENTGMQRRSSAGRFRMKLKKL